MAVVCSSPLYLSCKWIESAMWWWGPLSLILWGCVLSLQPFKSSFSSQNESNLYLFSFSFVWNGRALLFSSLAPQDPHSFSIISPLPSIHRSVLSVWTAVLSPGLFLSEPYLSTDISLCGHWGGGEKTCMTVFFHETQKRKFGRISQTVLFQIRT